MYGWSPTVVHPCTETPGDVRLYKPVARRRATLIVLVLVWDTLRVPLRTPKSCRHRKFLLFYAAGNCMIAVRIRRMLRIASINLTTIFQPLASTLSFVSDQAPGPNLSSDLSLFPRFRAGGLESNTGVPE